MLFRFTRILAVRSVWICLVLATSGLSSFADTLPKEAVELTKSSELRFGDALLPHSKSGEEVQIDGPLISSSVFDVLKPQNLQGFVGAVTAPDMPSLGDYFRQSEVRSISMSPDGRKLAVIKRVSQNNYAVYILDLEQGGKAIYGVPEPAGRIIANVVWLTNSRIGIQLFGLLRIGEYRIPYARLLAINVDGTNPVALLGADKNLKQNLDLSSISSFLPNDPDHVQMMAYDRTVNLYKVNIHSGEGSVAYRGGTRTVGFVSDVNGVAKMRIDFYAKSKSVRIFRFEPKRNRWVLISQVKLDGFQEELTKLLSSVSGTEEIVMVARRDDDEFAKLHTFNVNTKTFTGTLFEVEKYDLKSTISNPWSGQLMGVTHIDDRPVHHYFHPQVQSVQTRLESAFPNGGVQISSISSDMRRYLFFNDEPWRPGTFNVYDSSINQVRRIVDINPVLNVHKTTSVDILRYTTPDGKTITGYLTYPYGRNLEALPLIVFPHGGPFARDWLRYDVFVQYWATRGYAVFQPNFRGSTGYGRTFEQAGYREYGGAMIDDINAGVRALVKSGRVDAERICTAGISYGGYAALMAPLKSDLYKCAVSVNGVTDLALQMRSDIDGAKEAEIKKEVRNWLQSRIGHLEDDKALLDQQSPLKRHRELDLPVLLIAAKDDETVTVENSRQLKAAMSEAEMFVQYFEFEKGGHSLVDSLVRMQMLTLTERFFFDYIGRPGIGPAKPRYDWGETSLVTD